MHDLTPVTALGGTTPRVDTVGTLTLTERNDVAIASVAARKGGATKTKAAMKKMIGAAAPDPMKWAGKADVTAIWSAPDQWMVCAPMESHELLADDLVNAVAGSASVTEQSGAWVQFDVTGDAVLDLLERLCALPVRSMATGDANRTRIEQLGCFVVFTETGVSIIGPRASAGSLHHALMAAAHSVA